MVKGNVSLPIKFHLLLLFILGIAQLSSAPYHQICTSSRSTNLYNAEGLAETELIPRASPDFLNSTGGYFSFGPEISLSAVSLAKG